MRKRSLDATCCQVEGWKNHTCPSTLHHSRPREFVCKIKPIKQEGIVVDDRLLAVCVSLPAEVEDPHCQHTQQAIPSSGGVVVRDDVGESVLYRPDVFPKSLVCPRCFEDSFLQPQDHGPFHGIPIKKEIGAAVTTADHLQIVVVPIPKNCTLAGRRVERKVVLWICVSDVRDPFIDPQGAHRLLFCSNQGDYRSKEQESAATLRPKSLLPSSLSLRRPEVDHSLGMPPRRHSATDDNFKIIVYV
mmetsp:Transcript_34232/g.72925  ORF Transcript_34232/g.72925 Transcript_34232/m.72925 type:complete len:245 (+) Transcript_34232:1232-1966(+)